MWNPFKKAAASGGQSVKKQAAIENRLILSDILLPNPEKNTKTFTAVYDDAKFLSLAASLAEKSTVYIALYEFAKNERITPWPVKDIQELPSGGLKGSLEHIRVMLGDIKLMRQFNIDINPALESANKLLLEGKTVAFLSIGQDVRAIFAFTGNQSA